MVFISTPLLCLITAMSDRRRKSNSPFLKSSKRRSVIHGIFLKKRTQGDQAGPERTDREKTVQELKEFSKKEIEVAPKATRAEKKKKTGRPRLKRRKSLSLLRSGIALVRVGVKLDRAAARAVAEKKVNCLFLSNSFPLNIANEKSLPSLIPWLNVGLEINKF